LRSIVQQPRSLRNPFTNSSSLEGPLIRRLENYCATNLIDVRSNAIVFRNSFTTLDSVRPFAGDCSNPFQDCGINLPTRAAERLKRGANVGCPRQPRSFLAVDARAAEWAVREFYRRIREHTWACLGLRRFGRVIQGGSDRERSHPSRCRRNCVRPNKKRSQAAAQSGKGA
jgi:hypothetical protein